MKRSNCGGNSAALAACKGYVTVLQLWAADHDGQSFRIDQADMQTRRELGRLPGASWIRSARLMARSDDVRVDAADEKRIIMVCDHAYDNVPQRIFGRSPMAHAVAYSTGETGLISPAEYARLDLSGFIDLTLTEPMKVEPDGAANGSQPIRSETNTTSSAAGSRR
ncbi:MAG: hypothetical protein H6966_00025 [Chromatiaceae bacterium]|nr:hypothetical protein [Chromatiaceae bacterium]